ncbi:HIT family protein [Candidatus Saccharibacteria bacterium]|nr:HIT family protein [Candidatus Saccharibacteria bacterium]
MSQYHHKAARSQDQLEEMRRLDKEGKCILCPEFIHEDIHDLEIETEQWMVKKNRYPYENTKLHILIIPKEHVKSVSELTKEAKESFLDVVSECERKYDLNSYAVALRSGDMRFNGGSIEHLHAHLVVGDVDNKKHQPIRFKMSSRPED